MKMACFIMQNRGIPFYGPILKHINPNLLDLIILNKKDSNQYIYEYDLDKFDIKTNKNEVSNYTYMIGDVKEIPTKKKAQKTLGLFHAMDGIVGAAHLPLFDAFILPFEKAAANGSIKKEKLEKYKQNFPQINICELAWSGPWHCGEYASKPKQYFLDKISNNMSMPIDSTNSLVFTLEGECGDMDELIEQVNRMTEYCTVLFKPHFLYGYPEKLKKISQSVHVVSERFQNAWACRYASDFIMASFYSGSGFTSMMLEQYLLCFYSSFEKLNWDTKVNEKRIPFKDFIGLNDNYLIKKSPLSIDPIHANFFKLFYKNGLFFNLNYNSKFYSAVTTQIFKETYKNILPKIQNELFGKYDIINAAKKTASLIMEYIQNGTFGDKGSGFIPWSS